MPLRRWLGDAPKRRAGRDLRRPARAGIVGDAPKRRAGRDLRRPARAGIVRAALVAADLLPSTDPSRADTGPAAFDRP